MPDWLVSWTMISVVIFGVNFIFLTEAWMDCLDNTLKPDGQNLATTCYVDKKVAEKSQEKFDGYIIRDGQSIPVKKIEETKTEVEIEYRNFVRGYSYDSTLWIPKKDFHKYYTLEELSEKVNKTK